MTLRDRHGLIAGRVADLYMDRAGGDLLYLGVVAGPGISGQVLVPVDDVVATSDPLDVELRVPYTGAEVRAAPVCPAGALPTVGTEIAVRRHFARAGARGGDVAVSAATAGLDRDPADVRAVRWGT
jgi:hypothetical protein